MPLQSFVDNSLPTIKAAWLNAIDAFYFTLFNSATTAADARTALGSTTVGDAVFIAATAAAARTSLGALAAANGITTGTLDISEALAISGDISPAALSGNTDNWAPTGIATATVIRVDPGNFDLTGITAGVDGRVLVLQNISTSAYLVLKHNVTSTTTNRFFCPLASDVYLTGNSSAILQYDATSSRWRVILVQYPPTTQGAQEAGSSPGYFVTPDKQQYHPSSPKFWAYVTVSGGTPTLAASYNVTSITDTGPGILTVTIATDFSSVNWECEVAVERASTTLTVANLRYAAVRNGGQAAGTILVECWDGTATTAQQVDPAAWHVSGKGDQ